MSTGLAFPDGVDTLIGKVVQGRFQVEKRIAAGGMGVVYRAIQLPLGRPVAFKVLELAMGASDPSFQRRFFLEASAAAKLSHPNTIVVHDYGRTDEGQYYIAMEYLEGASLSERLADHGPLSPAEAIHVGMQIASSLHEAHEQGLVHRDLKPGNVMFSARAGDPLFVKVLDFGLVKVVGAGPENVGLTASGVMMGSPRYMAPEQVRAKETDARTDIYSFGAVMHHMLAGAPPFDAGSAFEAMHHHVHTPAPSLHDTWQGCPAPPEFDAIVRRCMEKDPAARFQTMHEVMVAMRALQAGHIGVAPHSAMSSAYLSSAHVLPPSEDSIVSPAEPAGSARQTVRLDDAALSSMIPPPTEHSRVVPSSPASTPSGPASLVKFALGGIGAGLLVAGLAVGAAFAFGVFGEASGASGETTGGPGPEPVVAVAQEQASGTDATEATNETARQGASVEPNTAPPPTGVAPPVPAEEAPPPLLLHSDPPGATVRRNGEDLGDTPLPLVIPRGDRWTISVSLTGYMTRVVQVAAGQPTLTLQLDPMAEPSAAPPSTPPSTRGASTPSTGRRGRSAGRGRSRGGTYTPDLNDPWATRR